VSKKIKLYDKRKIHICFLCEKKIHHNSKRFMVAFDGYHQPVNLWIHRKCYDPTKIEEILKDDEKRPRIIKDSVYW